MTTCETCNDTHSMSLRGSLVPCTRCPTPCQECRINGRGAYCAKTPCACACHSIVEHPAPTPTPAPGLDLDAVDRAERSMTPGPWRAADGSASAHGPGTERIGRKMVPLTVFGCAETNDRNGIVALRNAAPALIAEVRALRARLAEAKRLGMEACRVADRYIDPFRKDYIRSDDEKIAAIRAALEAL